MKKNQEQYCLEKEQGSYEQLLLSGTLTGDAMKTHLSIKEKLRIPREFMLLERHMRSRWFWWKLTEE